MELDGARLGVDAATGRGGRPGPGAGGRGDGPAPGGRGSVGAGRASGGQPRRETAGTGPVVRPDGPAGRPGGGPSATPASSTTRLKPTATWWRYSGALLVVDGYNLARTAWSALEPEEERRRTVALLEEAAARRGTPVTVVFDGDGSVAPAASRSVRTVFSAAGVTADEAIADLLHTLSSDQEVVVVSSDREVLGRRPIRARPPSPRPSSWRPPDADPSLGGSLRLSVGVRGMATWPRPLPLDLTSEHTGLVVIDCDDCRLQDGDACADCVVTYLCGVEAEVPVVVDLDAILGPCASSTRPASPRRYATVTGAADG